MKKITFPLEETWHPEKRVVVFPVKINGSKIDCEITLLALKEAFGADPSDPLKAFQGKRRFIQSRTMMAIAHQWFEPDGTIRLTTSDCIHAG